MKLKRMLFIFGIFILFLFGSYKVFFYWDSENEKRLVNENVNKVRLHVAEFDKLQEGDIILRRGYGFFSDFIAEKLNDTVFDVTHAGILIKKKGLWYVVHSLSSDVSKIDGVQIQKLTTFLSYSQPKKILITRLKNTSKEKRKKIALEAVKILEKKIPFDHYGNIEDATKMYCTEMIWYILESKLDLVNIPQEKEERKAFFYSMKCMYDSKYFDFVINQYVEKKE